MAKSNYRSIKLRHSLVVLSMYKDGGCLPIEFATKADKLKVIKEVATPLIRIDCYWPYQT